LIESSTIRILNPTGKTVGTGFLVAPNLAVTCAHVIVAADAIDGDIIQIQFTNQTEKINALVKPGYWRDVNKGDIAFLHLDHVPDGIKPLPLGPAESCRPGSGFRSFGYATAGSIQGIHVNGTIDGYLPEHRLLQLQSPQANHGISGSLVWDEARGLVVGMITQGHRELGRNQETTFATPTERLLEICPELKPQARPENPFGDRGRIEDPERYFVRQPLTREVLDELRKRQSVSIVGDSQTGKSSLLWYITRMGPELLNRPTSDFAYFSMELVRSEDEFFEYLCDELGVPHCRGYKLEKALRGRQVILCLDEIEKMTWQGFSHDIRSELRGLADGASAPLTLVIASRSPLGQVFPDSPGMTSPLAGLCNQLSVPPFTPPEALALAHFRLNGTGASLPDSLVETSCRQANGHPAALQKALHDLYEGMYP
jgi:hypothetical protein